MREIPLPDRPERLPESSQEVFQGNRLTSLVYIMRERSPFSHLGILDFQAGSLSLRDAKGGQLFAVPAETVQARPPAGSSTRPSGRSMVVPGRVYHPGQVPAAVDTGTDRALPRPRAGTAARGDERRDLSASYEQPHQASGTLGRLLAGSPPPGWQLMRKPTSRTGTPASGWQSPGPATPTLIHARRMNQ
jgi:hypothetical protein